MTGAEWNRLSGAMHRHEQAEDAKRRFSQRPTTTVVTTNSEAAPQMPRPAGPSRTGKKRNWLTRLPLSADHAAMVIAGVKTQAALRGVWTLPRPRPLLPVVVREVPHGPIGSEPLAQVKVLGRTHRTLGSYTDHDACAEGMRSLDDYKQAWSRWCGPWDPRQVITVVQFRYVRPEEAKTCRESSRPAASNDGAVSADGHVRGTR
jgi:hypothetical protein